MFCCPVQEEESLGGNGAPVYLFPVESQLEVQRFLNLLHLLKPLTSLGLLPTRDFTGRNGKTELFVFHGLCFWTGIASSSEVTSLIAAA